MTKKWTTVFAMLVACATLPAHAQDVPGNIQAGQTKATMCIGCHGIPGYQATFPEVHKVPMISGQSAAYIVAALDAYRKGARRHPTMRGIASSMSDQDMADVAAFYQSHNPSPSTASSHNPPAQVAALIEKGACFSCHGEGFKQPIDATYPKVAGQYADYVYAALKSYNTVKNDRIGRDNGVMAAITAQFSNQELKMLANYLGSLEGDLKVVPQERFR